MAAVTPENIYIETLGCKVNTFDSASLEHLLKAKGYNIVASAKEAQVTIINSCSVTHKAESDARYLLRRYRKENPENIQVLTGCYAQIQSERLKSLQELDYIVPNEAKEQLADLLHDGLQNSFSNFKDKLPTAVKAVLDNKQQHFKSSLTLFAGALSNRTRAFLKIQDGCNDFCTYCQIPYARGTSRSVTPDKVLAEAVRCLSEGVKELVFTGIHLGHYGEDLGQEKLLLPVLQELLSRPEDFRIRLSSLEPSEVSRELLELMAQHRGRFCAHFHLPLQSGSQEILKRMRRKYTPDEFLATVALIREYMPESLISSDVMVGFPGESDEHFAETLAFVQKAGLGGLHVFSYSKRPNTQAARMPGHITPEVIRQRSKALRTLGQELSQRYQKQFIGQTLRVLWEGERNADGYLHGKTDNYLAVTSRQSLHSTNSFVELKVQGFFDAKTLLVG